MKKHYQFTTYFLTLCFLCMNWGLYAHIPIKSDAYHNKSTSTLNLWPGFESLETAQPHNKYFEENGQASSTPIMLQPGTHFSDTLAIDGYGMSTYQFVLPVASAVEFTNCGSSMVDTYMYLYDDMGNELQDDTNSPSGQCNKSSLAYFRRHLDAGTYTIESYEDSGLAGNLVTQIIALAVPENVPDGATIGQPIDIGLLSIEQPVTLDLDNSPGEGYRDLFINGRNHPSDDIFIRFELGQTAKLAVNTCGSGFDTFLHLLRDDAKRLTSSDNSGASNCDDDQMAYIVYELDAGVYYIVAEGNGNAAGPLQLDIRLLPGRSMNTPIDMGTFAIGSTYEDTQTMRYAGLELVYYTFNLSTKAMVEISNCGSEVTESLFLLEDAERNEVTYQNRSLSAHCGNDRLTQYNLILEPGQYFLNVLSDPDTPTPITTRIKVTDATLGGRFEQPVDAGTLSATQGFGMHFNNVKGSGYGNRYAGPSNNASEDVFVRFTIDETIPVAVSTCESDFVTALHLLNSAGQEINTFSESSGEFCYYNRAGFIQELDPGTYYAVAEGQGTASGHIALEIQPIRAQGANLSNPIEVGTLSLGQGYNQTVSNEISEGFTNAYEGPNAQPSDDVFFRFTLTDSATVKLSTCNSSVGDTYLHLLDSAGTHLSSNDNSPRCTISSDRAYIQALLGPGTYYTVAESNGTELGRITLNIEVVAPIFTPECTATVYSLPYLERFESYPQGWQQEEGDRLRWLHITNEITFEGRGKLGVSSAYNEREYSTIYTPCFELPDANGEVIAARWVNRSHGDPSGSVRLAITTDGKTWTQLETMGGGGSITLWKPRYADLTPYAGKTVKLRFQMRTGYRSNQTYNASFDIDYFSISTTPLLVASGETYNYAESFDYSLGDWRQDIYDEIDWTTTRRDDPITSVDGPGHALVVSNDEDAKGNLYSPYFDLTNVAAGQRMTVEFKHFHRPTSPFSPSTPRILALVASTNGRNWGRVWAKSERNDGGNGWSWYRVSADISEYIGQRVQFRFEATASTVGHAVDDFRIITEPGGSHDVDCLYLGELPFTQSIDSWENITEGDDINWIERDGLRHRNVDGDQVLETTENTRSRGIYRSPCLDFRVSPADAKAVLKFSYGFYGHYNLSLALEASVNGEQWQQLWERDNYNVGATGYYTKYMDVSQFQGEIVQFRFVGEVAHRDALISLGRVTIEDALPGKNLIHPNNIGTLHAGDVFADVIQHDAQLGTNQYYQFELLEHATVNFSTCGSTISRSWLTLYNENTSIEQWRESMWRDCEHDGLVAYERQMSPGIYMLYANVSSSNPGEQLNVGIEVNPRRGATLENPFDIRYVDNNSRDQLDINLNPGEHFGDYFTGPSNTPSEDAFIRFEPLFGMHVAISTCGSNFDTRLALLDSLGNEIATANSSSPSQCGDGQLAYLIQYLPKAVYYVVVEGDGSTGGYADVDIRMADVTGPSRQNPIAVGTLSAGQSYDDIQNNLASNGFGDLYTGPNNQESDDIFYQFTLDLANNITITTCGSGLDDTFIHLIDQGGNWIASNDDTEGDCANSYQSQIDATLFPGTYYVVVEGYGTAAGDITTQINVAANDNPCGIAISSFPYEEGFETGFGGFFASPTNDFDWVRQTGSTPSSGTGPGQANGGTYYVYMEASSPNYPNKNAILNAPCFDFQTADSSQLGIGFYYHMDGSSLGQVVLEASTDGSVWNALLTLSSREGIFWQYAQVSLAEYAGQQVQIRFNGTTANSWQGDMAIDDIVVGNLTTAPGSRTAESSTWADAPLQAYPNPVKHTLFVKYWHEDVHGVSAQVELMDTKGVAVAVRNQVLTAGVNQLEMGTSDVPAGAKGPAHL